MTRVKVSEGIRQSGYMFSQTVVITFLGVLFGIVLARLLGPEQYGILAVLLAFHLIFTKVSDLGINGSLVYFIAGNLAQGKSADVRACIVTGGIIKTVMGILLAAIIVLASGPLSLYFGIPDPRYLYAVAAMVLIVALVDYILSTFTGFREFRYLVVSRISGELLKTAAAIGLVILGYGVWGALGAMIAGFFLTLMFSYYFFHKKVLSDYLGEKKRTEPYLKKFLNYGFFFFINSVFAFVITKTDILFLSRFRNYAEVGSYNIGISFIMLLSLIPLALIYVIFPTMASHKFRKDMKSVRENLTRICKFMSIFNFPIAVYLAVMSTQAVVVILTGSYDVTIKILWMLAISGVLYSFSQVFSFSIAGLGKVRSLSKIVLIQLALNLALNLYLVPRYGVYGAASALIATNLLGVLLMYALISHATEARLCGVFAKPLIASALMGAFLYFQRNLVSPYWLVFSVGSGALVYFTALSLLHGFEEEDIRILKQISTFFGPFGRLMSIGIKYLEAVGGYK
ncbi:MAG: flippase [archaeon]